MKKLSILMVVALLIGVATAQAQQKKYSVYAVGFYNLENLFDTCHDVGHNDYEYLPDGQNKWTGMKYTNKLRNMARVLSEMGTDMLPMSVGCAFIGVSEVENARCLTDLCAQEPLAARNMQFCHIEGPDQRGVDCALLYNPSLFTVRDVKLVPYIYITRGQSSCHTWIPDCQRYIGRRTCSSHRQSLAQPFRWLFLPRRGWSSDKTGQRLPTSRRPQM